MAETPVVPSQSASKVDVRECASILVEKLRAMAADVFATGKKEGTGDSVAPPLSFNADEEKLIRQAVDWVIAFAAKKNGIPQEYHKYLSFADLSWNEITGSLEVAEFANSESLPCLSVLREWLPRIVCALRTRRGVEDALSHIVYKLFEIALPRDLRRDERDRKGEQNSFLSIRNRRRRFVVEEGYHEGYSDDGASERGMYCEEKLSAINYPRHPFIYACELSFKPGEFSDRNSRGSYDFVDGRIINCHGYVHGRSLLECVLVGGQQQLLEVDCCDIYGGKIMASSALRFSLATFGGKPTFSIPDKCQGFIFEACDFSAIDLDDDMLQKVARVSKNCIFSKGQKEKLPVANGNRTAGEMRQVLTRWARKDAEGNLHFPSLAHFLPITASEQQKVYCDHNSAKGENAIRPAQLLLADGARELFPPLGKDAGELFRHRITFFRALSEFATKEHSFEEWLAFLKDPSTKAAFVLNLDEETLDLLPTFLDRFYNYRGEYCAKPALIRPEFHYTSNDQIYCHAFDLVDISIKESRMPVVKSWQAWDSDQRKNVDCTGELSVNACFRVIRAHLIHVFEKLGIYGRYLKGLEEKGLHWSEFSADADKLSLDELFHPSLLEKKGGEKMQIVKNSIVLNPKEGGVVLVRGPHSSGKSFLNDALACAVGQLQTGAPTTAKTQINPDCFFDGEFTLVGGTTGEMGRKGGGNFATTVQHLNTFLEKIKNYIDASQKIGKTMPVRLLVALDEIIQQSTSPENAARVEAQFIEALTTMPGAVVTVVLTSQNTSVYSHLEKMYSDLQTIIPDENLHQFRPKRPDESPYQDDHNMTLAAPEAIAPWFSGSWEAKLVKRNRGLVSH